MASSKIKGITIQIGGDTTGLDKALKKVDSTIKTTQDDLREVNKALKLDPKNTELLAQKQRLLAEAVSKTADKLKSLKDAQKQAQDQLERGKISQEQYNALAIEIGKTEAALKAAKEEAAEFNDQFKRLSREAADVANATRGISVAGAATVATIATAAVKTAEWADELLTLSQQTGISTEQLQKFQYASDLVDVSVESMTGALAKMTRQLTGAGEEKFRALGVATRDANGALRDSELIFYDVLAALGRIGNETERDVLAMEIFGKSANELAGIIDDGGAALKAYGDEAERNGSIVENELVESMGAFQDKIDQFKASALPELLKAGGAAIEALTPLLESLVGVLTGFLQIIGSIDPTLLQVVVTLGLFAASLSPIANIISKAIIPAIEALVSGGALKSMTEILGSTAGKATVVVALLGLLVALIMQISNAWGDMSGWEKAISVMGALVVAATAAAIALGAVQSAASMGIAAAAIVAGVVAITAAVNSATKRAEQNQLTQQRGGIPMMADGGVLSSGSAIVGEAGPELLTMQGGRAVVQPLTNNYTTNYNTSSQPLQVNIQLDGQTMARALVSPMSQQMALAGGSSIY